MDRGFDIDPAATVQIGANHPGDPGGKGRRTPLQLGLAPVDIPLGTTTATVTASGVSLALEGGGATNLTEIASGTSGDLLVVRLRRGAGDVTLIDDTSLRLASDFPVTNPNDTLMMVRRANAWNELSRSDND